MSGERRSEANRDVDIAVILARIRLGAQVWDQSHEGCFGPVTFRLCAECLESIQEAVVDSEAGPSQGM